MLIVGITGRSGSGKSSVTRHYAQKGYPVADGDVIYRDITQPGTPCLAALAKAFGGGILRADGSLDRQALGGLVFNSAENNQKLIDISHPFILEVFKQQEARARAQGQRLFFLDGAVIVGGPVQAYCDKIIVLRSETRLSISRIILRDGISKTAAASRLSAQQPEEALVAAANYVIDNNGSEAALLEKADQVLLALLAEADKGENRD